MRTFVIVACTSGLAAIGLLLWLAPQHHESAGSDDDPPTTPIKVYRGDPVDLVVTSQSLDGAVLDTQIGSRTVISLASDVFFDFDRADLNASAGAELDTIASRLKGNSSRNLHIDGYTDAKGAPDYNVNLSKRRAEAVQAAIQPKLPGFEFDAEGHGAADPVAANSKPDGSDDPAGRAKNRRVTISFGPS